VSVINLLGDRRDAESASRIAEIALSQDAATADAAIASLGKIADSHAIQALRRLHSGRDATRRAAAAHALLQCGQELAARVRTAAAVDVYKRLTVATEIPHIRRPAALALERLNARSRT
jgi:HEAT repeat protein